LFGFEECSRKYLLQDFQNLKQILLQLNRSANFLNHLIKNPLLKHKIKNLISIFQPLVGQNLLHNLRDQLDLKRYHIKIVVQGVEEGLQEGVEAVQILREVGSVVGQLARTGVRSGTEQGGVVRRGSWF
jgi:hypothetical protein